MANIKSQRIKLSDFEVMEIYRKAIEKKEKYSTPYFLSIRTYGIRDWTSFKKRVRKIIGK